MAIAGGGIVVLYLVGAALVRNFATGIPSAEDLEPQPLADVDYRFRCVVCAAEVIMYAAPDGDVPVPPRHCAERMDLIAPTD
jgi:hypothetical protein